MSKAACVSCLTERWENFSPWFPSCDLSFCWGRLGWLLLGHGCALSKELQVLNARTPGGAAHRQPLLGSALGGCRTSPGRSWSFSLLPLAPSCKYRQHLGGFGLAAPEERWLAEGAFDTQRGAPHPWCTARARIYRSRSSPNSSRMLRARGRLDWKTGGGVIRAGKAMPPTPARGQLCRAPPSPSAPQQRPRGAQHPQDGGAGAAAARDEAGWGGSQRGAPHPCRARGRLGAQQEGGAAAGRHCGSAAGAPRRLGGRLPREPGLGWKRCFFF